VGVVIVDLLVGFCSQGALSSPRVGALGSKAAAMLTALYEAGVRDFAVARDSHPPDALEFAVFPPHCLAGSAEAEEIPEISTLSFHSQIEQFPKNSLSVGMTPAFREWVAARPEVTTWVVVGDCTDLCVYQTALHLRLDANERGIPREVWVPASVVDTYDLPVEAALQVGALPHDGDLLHRVFLYHLALNGVRVAGEWSS
jgi:nicotinamidase-related amidase